jgi:hypothetical protein
MRRGAWLSFVVALAARLAVVVWSGGRFPPAEDGHYYDVIARRIAAGDGYRWLWPDGAVTYAAHYPVGYPAMVGAFYALLGAKWWAPGLLNALVGAAAAPAAHHLVAESDARPSWRPLAASLTIALHPALVLYTPAEMTEGLTAALLTIAAALAARSRTTASPWLLRIAAAVALGLATLVRPQSIALAPVLGALAMSGDRGGAGRGAAFFTALALLTCLPWTVRNCVRMDRCALVSVNGGWNLLIGARSVDGSWSRLDPPPECRTVWSEAGKDTCFEEVAVREIVAAPARWMAKMPAKLAATFDGVDPGSWYLHASNPEAFGDRARDLLGRVERATANLAVLAALLAGSTMHGARRRARRAVAALGAAAALAVHAWLGYAALVVTVALLGRSAVRGKLLVPWTGAAVLVTALVHAAFFGAGRYGLVVAPLVAAFAWVRAKPIPPVESASCTSSASSGSSSPSSARPSSPSAVGEPSRASALYW